MCITKVRAPFECWLLGGGVWCTPGATQHTRFINKAMGSSWEGTPTSHCIALIWRPRTKAGWSHPLPRSGAGGQGQGKSPAFSPLFLVENPLKSPSSSLGPGKSPCPPPHPPASTRQGGVSTGLIASSLLRNCDSAGVGRALPAGGGKWLLKRMGRGFQDPLARHCWCGITTQMRARKRGMGDVGRSWQPPSLLRQEEGAGFLRTPLPVVPL